MKPSQGWARACLVTAVLLLAAGSSWGTDVTPEDEYKKLIRVDENIDPLGEHPFGEEISLYDGSLSFTQTDISLGGNGLPLTLIRQFRIEHDKDIRKQFAFGDWDLVLPHLETMTVSGYDGSRRYLSGWTVAANSNEDPYARCTHFRKPPIVWMHPDDPALAAWQPVQWWKGYHLVIPGQGSQDLLKNPDPASPYTAITKEHWRLACTSMQNNALGEGFIAQAPDGTRYWFNELVYRDAQGLTAPLYDDSGIASIRSRRGLFESLATSSGDAMGNLISLLTGSTAAHAVPVASTIPRQTALMLVTKIQDRFGNKLLFSYDQYGRLTRITSDDEASNDERVLILAYVGDTPRVHTATLTSSNGGPSRTWTYGYDDDLVAPALTSVTLPDGSEWLYSLGQFNAATLKPSPATHSSCLHVGEPPSLDTVTGTVIHPSGLKGTFELKPTKRGRSFVPFDCKGTGYTGNEDNQGSYVSIPNAWYQFSLQQRTLSGAGIPPGRTWRYFYSDAHDSWSNCTGACPTTVYTDVQNPDGGTERYLFSNKYDHTESQLLKVTRSVGAFGTTEMRVDINNYAPPGTTSLPDPAGSVLQDNVNRDQVGRYSPLNLRKIIQDGDTYTWEARFNSWGQPIWTRRSNSINAEWTVEEQLDYLNDTTQWVLGLPLRVTNLTAGEVVDEYDYQGLVLTDRLHFGQTIMHYSFNAQGQLIAFTDGNSHTTSLGSYIDHDGAVVSLGYKRGIPLAIGYPDGTHQILEVNDFGEVQRITDQANATTQYDYDPAGRLHQIRYPAGERSWNVRTITYAPVDATERGLVGRHWRRTAAKGDQRQVTYYNAQLQPVLVDTYIDGQAGSHSNVYTAYDYRGQATFTSYPMTGVPAVTAAFRGVHNEYDKLGRLHRTLQDAESGVPGANADDQLVTVTDYPGGATRSVTDPRHYTTTTSYQVFDQPSYDAPVKVVAPAGVIQEITRNLYGNPTKIHQYGTYNGYTSNVTKYLVYDEHQRLCRTSEPESGSEVMDYDPAGNLLWSASGLDLPIPVTGDESECERDQVIDGKVIRHYDPMNRMDAIDYPDDAADATFHYDPLGRVHTAQSGIATWTYEYNNIGLLRSQTLDMDGYHWPIVYDHDANGAVEQITYPDGKQVAYRPDALGRPTQVGVYAGNILYEPDGSLKYFLGGNGVDYLAQKNDRNILGDFTYAIGDTLLVSQAFHYDANGNRTAVADLADVAGTRTKSYQYDPLNRLTVATANNLWGVESYKYDPVNNLRSMYTDGKERVYDYDGRNRLAEITIDGTTLHSFGYDPQGNTTHKDNTILAFDRANRLSQVTGIASYNYDASGRRVKKTGASGAKTYYAYGSAGKLLFQLDAATGTVTDYVYLGTKLLAKVRRGAGDQVLNPPPNIYFDTNPNAGNYTVMWFKVPNARYELEESSNGGIEWQPVYSGTDDSKAFSSKAAGSYLYRVRACLDECSDWRYSVTLGVWPELATVTVPSGLQSAGFTVSWTRPSTATYFDVDEQKDGGTWARIATGTPETSITRPLLAVGSYVYRVAARNSHGSRGWAVSDPVTVLYPPTGTPTLNAPSVSSTPSYTVSWSADVNADRYQLQEQKDGGAWSLQYEGANLSTVVSGVTNGAHYGYQVRACNAAGCGPYSAVDTVAIAIPPPAPTGVYVNDLTVNPKMEVRTVVWNASSGASYYQVKDVTTGVVKQTSATSLDVEGGYNVPVLLHDYAVSACNPWACSAYVNAVPRTVYNPPGSAPTLSAPSTSTGGYTVSWGSVYQASSYTLQESTNGGTWKTVYSGSGRSKAFSHANGSYAYRVRASNSGGVGPWSTTKTVTVATLGNVTGLGAYVQYKYSSLAASASQSLEQQPQPQLLPPPPDGDEGWYLSVHWNSAMGATRYEVQINGGSTLSVTELGLQTKVTSSSQSVKVRACNASTCSAWAGPVTAVIM